MSGLLIPIDWFPAWFQSLSMLLPFQAIAYYPLQIYLGRVDGSPMLILLMLQLFWVVVLCSAGRLVWRLCQRQILIQGG